MRKRKLLSAVEGNAMQCRHVRVSYFAVIEHWGFFGFSVSLTQRGRVMQ